MKYCVVVSVATDYPTKGGGSVDDILVDVMLIDESERERSDVTLKIEIPPRPKFRRTDGSNPLPTVAGF